MNKIIKIEGNKISIGTDDGKIIVVKSSDLNFDNPALGELVEVYRDEKNIIVARYTAPNEMPDETIDDTSNFANQVKMEYSGCGNVKVVNKNIFVWVCVFFGGIIGIDRFVRGQIFYGILKLITFGGAGIWYIVDFFVALGKAYGSSFGMGQDLVFVNGKYAK